jgi:hypothetical protein
METNVKIMETNVKIMETSIKFNIQKLKKDIKELVEKQKIYKNQKKTVHIIGERIMTAKEAWYAHYHNREKLRIMYAVYGLVRGKSFYQIENHYPEENHPLNKYKYTIDKMMNQYMKEEK